MVKPARPQRERVAALGDVPRASAGATCFLDRQLSALCWQTQSIDVPPNQFITLARFLLQGGAVKDTNFPMMRVDEPASLQFRGNLRDGRSLHPEHLGDEFMSKWN